MRLLSGYLPCKKGSRSKAKHSPLNTLRMCGDVHLLSSYGLAACTGTISNKNLQAVFVDSECDGR